MVTTTVSVTFYDLVVHHGANCGSAAGKIREIVAVRQECTAVEPL